MEAGQERLWLAREVVRSLEKALDASRRANTPSSPASDPRLEFMRSVRGYVRRHGALRIAAGAAGADENGKASALATELLLGGIHEIAIDPGVKDDELEGLLGALGAVGADAASRLLDVELEHVNVRTLDYVGTLERPEGYSPEVRNKLQEMQKASDERAKELDAAGAFGKGGLVYELTDSGGEFARIDKIRPPATKRADGDDRLEIPPEALAAFRARALETSLSDAVVLEVLDLVLQGFTADPDALGADNAKWFIETAPALAIKEGNLELLAAIVDRCQMELTVSGGAVAVAVNSMIQSLASKEGVEKLAALGSASPDSEAFCQILEALGEAGVVAALAAYQRSSAKEIRDALSRFLTANVAQCPQSLRPLLQPTSNTETAKFALFLVSKALQGGIADGLYEQARAHPKAQVSDYASFLWRTHTMRGRLAAFLESLDKPEPAERIRALDAIAKAKDREALEPLVKLIEDPSFLSRTPEEMRAFMNAVSEVGGPAMIKFFEKQSERSSGIFKIRAGTEVREQAKTLLRRLSEGGVS